MLKTLEVIFGRACHLYGVLAVTPLSLVTLSRFCCRFFQSVSCYFDHVIDMAVCFNVLAMPACVSLAEHE